MRTAKQTKPAAAAPQAAPAPAAARRCLCGCGLEPIRAEARFVSGHDARLKGNLQRLAAEAKAAPADLDTAALAALVGLPETATVREIALAASPETGGWAAQIAAAVAAEAERREERELKAAARAERKAAREAKQARERAERAARREAIDRARQAAG